MAQSCPFWDTPNRGEVGAWHRHRRICDGGITVFFGGEIGTGDDPNISMTHRNTTERMGGRSLRLMAQHHQPWKEIKRSCILEPFIYFVQSGLNVLNAAQ